MKTLFWGTLVVSTILFFIAIAISMFQINPDVPPAVKTGKLIWQKRGCTECHTLLGHGGYSAPELTLTYKTRGAKWLDHFFTRPPVMRPSKDKRHPGLKRTERGPMISFLAFVAKLNLNNWPPKNVMTLQNQEPSKT